MPEVGDSLGRYTLLKRLAQGGMGEVFLAAKPGPVGFGPRVALKVLQPQLASDQTFIDMLVDEANISMFLNHQNVVSVLDLAEERGTYYIAMEYVQGLNLEGLLERLNAHSYKLDVPTSLYIATELCRALKYAHTRVNHAGEPLGIVHRDVTPANILISTHGEVKLTDFGIARAKGRIHQTQAGVLKGKFGYMAPEMIRYEQIDARVDLFCAGCVTYLMVAGRHPVAGASMMEAIQRYEDKQVPKPSTFCAEIPPDLDAVIMRCLEPQVGARWPSAAALANALQEVVLAHPAWRREVQDGAQRLSEMMRSLAPEVFVDPVPPELASELLSKALGTPFKPAFLPVAHLPVAPALADPLADTQSPPHLEPRPSTGVGSSAAWPEVGASDPPTEESWAARDTLPPTPHAPDLPELETEESQLERVLEARAEAQAEVLSAPPRMVSLRKSQSGEKRELRPDTGDLAPKPEPRLVATVPSDPALDLRSPSPSPDLLEEPALPLTHDPSDGPRVGGAAANVGRERSDDGRTVVAMSVPDTPSDLDGGATMLSTEAIAEPELPVSAGGGASYDDGKTMLGMSMDQIEAAHAAEVSSVDAEDSLASTRAYASVDVPATADKPLEDREMVVPLATDAAGEWVASNNADPTLLDGMDSRAVSAALAAQRKASTQDVARSASPAQADLDRIVAESVMTGAHRAQNNEASPSRDLPRPISLHQAAKSVLTSDLPKSPGAQAPAVHDLAPPAAPKRPAPLIRERNRPPGESADLPMVARDPAAASSAVGPKTNKWMAGQLESNELEWGDDAAARRAVATRNAGRGGPAGTPAPHVGPALNGPYSGSAPNGPHSGAAPNGPYSGSAPNGPYSGSAPNGPHGGAGPNASLGGASLGGVASNAPYAAPSTPHPPYRTPAPNAPARTPAPGPAGFAPGAPYPGAMAGPVGHPGGLGHPGILPPASVSSAVRYPPGTFIGPDGRPLVPGAPPSVLARNWTVFVMFGAAVIAVIAVAGIVLFTQALWPKLRLESDPPGARVIVDGMELAGTAPMVVQVEPEKPHSIELRMEGFRSERREITDGVARMKTYLLQVALRRIVPSVDLGSVNGRVLVNGKLIGSGSRVQLLDLPLSEPVRVRVEADGYTAWEVAFERGSMVPESLTVPLTR